MKNIERQSEWGRNVPAEIKYVGALGAATELADVLYELMEEMGKVSGADIDAAFKRVQEASYVTRLLDRESREFGVVGEARDGVVEKYRKLMRDRIWYEEGAEK